MGGFKIKRGRVSTTIPATQTVSFYTKQRTGFGASLLSYTGSGTLSIVSQKDASNATVTIFQIGQNALSWKGASSTYGTAPPGSLNGPYTVVVTDGTVSSTVTIPIVANACGREMTSVANGGRWATDSMYTVDDHNADTPFGPPYTSQLNYYTDIFVLANNDHIVMRDGHLNPNDLTWGLAFNASYAGFSLTIESETVDSSLDPNGNANLKHGFKIGHLSLAPATTGLSYPVEFKNVQFTNDVATHSLLQHQFAGAIFGVKLTNCFVGFGASVTDTTIINNNVNGVVCDSITISGCRITNVATAYAGRATTAHPSSITSTVFHHTFVDNMNIDGVGWTITDNLIFDACGPVLGHPDCLQLNGFIGDNTNLAWAVIKRNIAVIDTVQNTQGIGFLTNQASAGDFKGLDFENNLSVMCGLNGMQLTGMDSVTCKFNTVIGDTTRVATGVNFYTPGTPQGTGLTADRNVSNGANFSNQLGVVTNTNAVTLTATTAAMNLMYPNLAAFLQGGGPVNPAVVMVAATPANLAVASGGAKQLDGTYSGAIKAGGVWNDGT